MTKTVLIIEDNKTQQAYYGQVLEAAGYQVFIATTAAEGLDLFQKEQPSVVALDLILPDRDGLDLMRDCHSISPTVQFVVITAHGTVQTAVKAMRFGAADFLPKPFSDTQLLTAIHGVTKQARVAADTSKQAEPAHSDPTRAPPLPGFIGYAPVMHELYRQIRAVSQSDVPVFLAGPLGSGRRTCARAIHDLAFPERPEAPFEVVSAMGLSPEAQLACIQGHEAGADIIQRAAGGTAYISEPCSLSDTAQAALMEAIQKQEVSESGPKARVVSSSIRDPFAEVRGGQLREDLFHRLYVAAIRVPPLKRRGEDVVAIANAALRSLDSRTESGFVGLHPEVAEFFRRYEWPGNVAQLLNVIRSTVLLHVGPLVTMDMLPIELTTPPEANLSDTPLAGLVGRSLADVEEILIEETIRQQNGSVPRAARVLDVSPSTLYRKREAWARRGAS